jgi:hypothetical protein
MSVKRMIVDAKPDVRATSDYARAIYDRLAMSVHPLDADSRRAMARIATDMITAAEKVEVAFDALLDEVRREKSLLKIVR